MDSRTPITPAQIVAPKRDETIIGLLREAVRHCPDKPFLIFPDHDGYRMSYATTLAGATAVAQALREAGMKAGARIAVYLPNGPAYALAWLGTLMAGTVDVTVNAGLRATPLAYALNKARVDLVISDHGGLAGLATAVDLAQEPPILLLHDGPDGLSHCPRTLRWGQWDTPTKQPPHTGDTVGSVEFPPVNPFGLASIRFTSGSTGFPKGVMMSQAHMLASAKMFCHMTEFTADDVLYSCFPVHHVFSSVTGVLAALAAQGTIVLAQRFSASQYWEHVRHYGVTVGHVLDAPVAILLSTPESDLDRAHRCRVMYTASQAFPRFEERFGVKILPLFDMSELTVVAYYPPGVPRREGSCGVSSSLFDIAILDDDDFPEPPGTEGQIAVRPRVPHVMMLGYFDDAELVVERWSNLWYHTNDRGILDEDGYLYFKGRLGDRIRRRGDNVSAAEIEAVAARHPAVAEVAVIGVPASLGEDDIKLCLTLKEGAAVTPQALLDHVSAELPKSLVPRYVEVREGFPRTDTEKIRKNVLREEGDHGLTATTWDAATNALIGSTAGASHPTSGHRV
jgi:crotonobetaine/carnitine-CoA ligase